MCPVRASRSSSTGWRRFSTGVPSIALTKADGAVEAPGEFVREKRGGDNDELFAVEGGADAAACHERAAVGAEAGEDAGVVDARHEIPGGGGEGRRA